MEKWKPGAAILEKSNRVEEFLSQLSDTFPFQLRGKRCHSTGAQGSRRKLNLALSSTWLDLHMAPYVLHESGSRDSPRPRQFNTPTSRNFIYATREGGEKFVLFCEM